MSTMTERTILEGFLKVNTHTLSAWRKCLNVVGMIFVSEFVILEIITRMCLK